ncbi:sirohydrochlorin chelatase [Streptomyces ovatisporus]|uniref:Sirohydrochlorin chelatase n=1 Tax=Streptomyces ovatisporus TaxID=1128682 RepID=A0ABV9AE40_9ACTN
MTSPPALLLVCDVSRDRGAAEAFRSFVDELAGDHADLTVAGALREPSGPSVSDAAAALAAEGATRIAAVPLTLVSDEFAERDVPAALSRAEEEHEGLSCTGGAALGPQPAMLALLERRIEEALSRGAASGGGSGNSRDDGNGSEDGNGIPAARTPDDRARITVLLVSPGSTDAHANAEVHRAARLLWEGRGYEGVEPAFVTSAAPDVASALDRCRKLGARKVVVQPCFLFAGDLSERVRQQSEGWGLANPQVEVVVAGVVGADAALAEVVLERYRETVRRMPGRPQEPHGTEDGATRPGSHAR